MSKPRKLKVYEEKLDEKLDIEQLAATAGDAYNIYAMNPDTSIPNCPKCGRRMKNHGKYERQYLDVIGYDAGKPRFITLHYLFYKYRCLDENCDLTLYQKPVDFAFENANVTKRLEDLIVWHATYMSYAQVEHSINATVSKQAVGQIAKRWVENKDSEREPFFYTPRTLGLLSFFWDNREYIIAVDAGDTRIHILDVLKGVETDEIILFLNHLQKEKIKYVVTDCNPIIVSAVKDYLPESEVLVDTDTLFEEALEAFKDIIKKDAKQTQTIDKELLLMNPGLIKEEDRGFIRRITKNKPRVNAVYDHMNLLRTLFAGSWDVTDIKSWEEQIPINCSDEFKLTSMYIDEYWLELLNFYKRRREVTPGLFLKLKILDEKLRNFKSCPDNLFRARILYLCKIGKLLKDSNGQWHGVPYEEVITMIDTLLNEMEDARNER